MTEKAEVLRLIAEDAAICEACELHQNRICSVFAKGSPDASLMFIGEAPGRDEDESGVPFVGASGRLLDKMIKAMGLDLDDVYVCNAVKCRPPDNRTPRPDEVEACSLYLRSQIAVVGPRVIVTLGRTAMLALGPLYAEPYDDSGRWRGKWRRLQHGTPVMPTYHPAFVLRNPGAKQKVGADLAKALKRLKG